MTASAEMPALAPAAGRMPPPATARTLLRSWWRGLCWLGLCLGGLSPARGEMYTSMVTVQQALATEAKLLQQLKTYLEEETSRLNDLKRFYEKVNTMQQGEGTPVSNPLLAYTLIKRLQSEWMNVVHSREASENAEALKNAYKNVEKELPQFEDLEGAARALMRLQDVYSLDVKGLVKGLFQRDGSTVPTSIYHPAQLFKMSADDCFHIGKVAYDMEDFYHSIAWLEEAVSLFRGSYGSWYTEDEGSLVDALDYLAFSYFRTGNISYALNLSRECLHYDPGNKRIARNVLKYEKILGGSPPEVENEVVLQRPNVTHLRTRDAYEELCQTLGSQSTPLYTSGLHCSLESNNSPYLMLQPVKMEVVSLQPYVVLYHDFITNQEAKTIKDIASPWLRRSVVASGERQSVVEYRISKSAWLKDTVDPVIGRVDLRIASLTGLNIQPPYAEYLQVVNYGIGGHYEPHFDHATSLASPVYKTNTGNRVATLMMYLSSVEVGGSTAFIYANFSVPVIKNAALFWWNLHRNGQGDGDTLHAGCPVLIGDKWVANKWIHEHGQEFRRQCSPSPDE